MSEGPHYLRRRLPERIPVDARSIALFRLGEQCNNACPMCSNSGRAEAFHQREAEMLGRADWLHAQGMRRVVLTGGEPTIHPAFWAVVARLGELGMVWDINTHGRSFADADFSERAVREGLQRAIVSFHTHRVEPSQLISGQSEKGHWETVRGIQQLRERGVKLMLNCVLTRHNSDRAQLVEYLGFCRHHFGTDYELKFVFPSTAGKGGGWEGIQLRYSEVQPTVRYLRQLAPALGMRLVFESFPGCVLGDRDNSNMSRSGFGETHYLDDVSGRDLYSIRHIEAHFNVFAERCNTCAARARCPGVAESYLRRHGDDELTPFR